MTTRTVLLALALLVTEWGLAHADTRCARVDNGVLVTYRIWAASDLMDADGCPPDAPHKGIAWLPAPEVAPPVYDDATQVLTGPTVTIGADQVTTSYSVRDKTAQELSTEADAVKEDRLDSVDTFVLKTLCDHESRIRKLEGKSEITLAQCRAAIKASLQ
jgi:hypothetical protein